MSATRLQLTFKGYKLISGGEFIIERKSGIKEAENVSTDPHVELIVGTSDRFSFINVFSYLIALHSYLERSNIQGNYRTAIFKTT